MKTLLAIVLLAIFGVVLYGVLDQHGNIQSQRREQAESKRLISAGRMRRLTAARVWMCV